MRGDRGKIYHADPCAAVPSAVAPSPDADDRGHRTCPSIGLNLTMSRVGGSSPVSGNRRGSGIFPIAFGTLPPSSSPWYSSGCAPCGPADAAHCLHAQR